jgi:hypothetical protein
MTSHRFSFIVLAGMLACAPGLAAQSQSWDKQFSAARRFVVLEAFDNTAVLDKETGLVWERTPSEQDLNWSNALNHCNIAVVGNRRGWRAPTLQEFASLLDPTVPHPGPQLTPGHPFDLNPDGAAFWTANTYVLDPTRAFLIGIGSGATPAPPKTSLFKVWCVRGGQGVDPQ